MDQIEQNEEINLWEYIEVLLRRKWLIIVPTCLLVLIVGIYSFLQTPVWEIDAVLQPSKFLSQTEDGRFTEVFVSEPKQIAGEINQASYNSIVAAETNADLRKMPKIQAENLRDTKLVRIWVRLPDIEKGKRILDSLFGHLQSELNKKIDVELKGIDSQIFTKENAIRQNDLLGKDKLNEIKMLEIKKTKLRQEITTEENKLKISEQRAQEITAEMKKIEIKIADFDERWKKVLSEQKQGTEAVLMLLYSSEAQTNSRYLNTLEENLSREKITQEMLQLSVKAKSEGIREFDAQIEKQKNEMEKVQTSSENIKQQTELLKRQKDRVDFANWVKVPTSSINPVAPTKIKNVLIAGICGLLFFGFLAFFLEYIEKNKKKIASK